MRAISNHGEREVVSMYVCVCNAITDRQIREAVENGCDTMTKLRDELGVARECGKCESSARELLEEITNESNWQGLLAPAAS